MEFRRLLDEVSVSSVHFEEEFSAETAVTAVVSDSRNVTDGCVFVALVGTKTDGHAFLADAFSKGASFAVIERGRREEVPAGMSFAETENTHLVLAELLDAWYEHPARGMKLIAVTGTNGKTSVSYMIRHILRYAGYRCGLVGTVRCLAEEEELDLGGGSALYGMPSAMTTPDPEHLYRVLAEMRTRGITHVVMEASSHALALDKLGALRFEGAVFTNLSSEHLDFHGTMENYFAAKSKLFRKTALAVVNTDDRFGARLAEDLCGVRCIRCSAKADSVSDGAVQCTAVNIRLLGADGIDYVFYGNDAVFRVKCPVPGDFTVYNSLLAAALSLEMGIELPTVIDALASFPGVDGRIEKVKIDTTKKDISVFIDYAHTPRAMESLLETVSAFRREGQRVITVFGCGGDRDRTKRAKMGAIASRYSDLTVVTSDNPRTEDPIAIIDEIMGGIDKTKPCVRIDDRTSAIRYAVHAATAGDIVLLVGKGHERYEIDREGKHPFDERKIAREAVDQPS